MLNVWIPKTKTPKKKNAQRKKIWEKKSSLHKRRNEHPAQHQYTARGTDPLKKKVHNLFRYDWCLRNAMHSTVSQTKIPHKINEKMEWTTQNKKKTPLKWGAHRSNILYLWSQICNIIYTERLLVLAISRREWHDTHTHILSAPYERHQRHREWPTQISTEANDVEQFIPSSFSANSNV